MGFPLQPPRVQMVDQSGNCTREWYLYFLGNREETVQAVDDGESSLLGIGAEEMRQSIYRLTDEVQFLTTQLAEQRELTAKLLTEIDELRQAAIWP